ncbi:hepatitis A virus cellular receptor 1 isoform X2 [Octodon degus]|uniref:Hepatitis A virus cellular receptor 1 isoform X2 n=1 Tax=Octodon degus TaxID=10160 RepID=A0A6P6E9I6_OCTDE|nr:hepatitis A virus cellular receptor 1 isoform X2 [Octodon degus]
MILQPQAVVLGLLLLQTGAVFSTQVNAVVGQSVTLPCTYTVSRGSQPICWGRGPCPSSKCSNTLLSTNGQRITYQKDRRYQLNGRISQGDVSLTIQNVNMGDGGQYCCRVELPGWFNDVKNTISLKVMPAATTRVPTTPRVSTVPPATRVPTTPRVSAAPPTPVHTQTRTTALTTSTRVATTPPVSTARPAPAHTENHETGRPTWAPTSAHVSTSAPPAPLQTQSSTTDTTPPVPTQAVETQPTAPQEARTQPTTSSPESFSEDGNGMVTRASDGSPHNDQSVSPAQNQSVTTKELYIGILVCSLVLLTILVVILIRKYSNSRKKTWTLSKVCWTRPRVQALGQLGPTEDKVYIVKDNIYILD